MAWLDVIPFASQVKAACQLMAGDVSGAKTTTLNFYTKTPVVSHVMGTIAGTVGLIANDDELKNFATEAFEGGTRTVSDALDYIPVVGLYKGAIHVMLGDEAGGERAMNASMKLFTFLMNKLEHRDDDYDDVLKILNSEEFSNLPCADVLSNLREMRQEINTRIDTAERTIKGESECDALLELQKHRKLINDAFDSMERKVRER